MRIAVVCERFDEWPESIGVSPAALARSLHAIGHEVSVICDCTRAAMVAPGITVQSMRGDRWRIVRRPLQFRPWALQMVRALGADTSLSICPSVEAMWWAPGTAWGATAMLDELRRSGAYTAFKRASQWLIPRTRAARAASRSPRSSPAHLLATDSEQARHVALLTGRAREKITLIGRAAHDPHPDAPAVRSATRRLLRIGPDSPVILIASEKIAAPGVARWLIAVGEFAATRPARAEVVVLHTGGKSAAPVTPPPGVRLIRTGRTERSDALLAASDLVAMSTGPSGMLDDSLAADALRAGVPVIAERGAPSAASLARDFPAAMRTLDQMDQAPVRAGVIAELIDTPPQRDLTRAATELDLSRWTRSLVSLFGQPR